MKRRIGFLAMLLIAMGTFLILPNKANAMSLSASTKTVQSGTKVKVNLYFYYGKKKPTWSVSNKKKATITSKGRTSCTIKTKSSGSVYVKCKVGKKTKKIKITIKPKSPVTYDNYSQIDVGMDLDTVCSYLGNSYEISYEYNQTEEEYNMYLEWNNEDGGWSDHLWRKKTTIKWKNPWDYHYALIEFKDGIVSDMSWH